MRKIIPFLILILGVIGFVLTGCGFQWWARPQTTPLPVISSPKINIGIESEASMRQNRRWYNHDTHLKISIRWSEVEPKPKYITLFGRRISVPGRDYDWQIPDRKLVGYRPDWITVKTSPLWASDEVCKLPERQYWTDAARFYQAVIDKYQPRYLEIWNEPNAETLVYPQQFGCIGDGQAYGEYVDYIYQAVSGADIIIGAVSDIYDPFVSDMLQAAGGSYDGLSFHCYEQYWDHLLDECLIRYDHAETLTDKPVYLSETAVRWKQGGEAGYERAQVQYFRRMRTLPTVWFWYTVCNNGWPVEMPTDMCGRPVWQEYNAAIRVP